MNNIACNEEIQARLRRDGGPMVLLKIKHKNGKAGETLLDPHTAKFVKRDLEVYGAEVEAVKV